LWGKAEDEGGLFARRGLWRGPAWKRPQRLDGFYLELVLNPRSDKKRIFFAFFSSEIKQGMLQKNCNMPQPFYTVQIRRR